MNILEELNIKKRNISKDNQLGIISDKQREVSDIDKKINALGGEVFTEFDFNNNIENSNKIEELENLKKEKKEAINNLIEQN